PILSATATWHIITGAGTIEHFRSGPDQRSLIALTLRVALAAKRGVQRRPRSHVRHSLPDGRYSNHNRMPPLALAEQHKFLYVHAWGASRWPPDARFDRRFAIAVVD